MQINSNTLLLNSEDYKSIEQFVTKLAEENKIENVESIHISITKDSGIVRFKAAQDPNQPVAQNPTPPAQDPNQAPQDPNQPATQDPNQAPQDPNQSATQDPNAQNPTQAQAPTMDPKAVVDQLVQAYLGGQDVAAMIKQQDPNLDDAAVNNAVTQIKQVAEQAKQSQQPA